MEGSFYVGRLPVAMRCEAGLARCGAHVPEEHVEGVGVATAHRSHQRREVVRDRPRFVIHEEKGRWPAARAEDFGGCNERLELEPPGELIRR